MSPETRDFLTTVRRAEDPTPGEESRVLAALEATLATSLTGSAAEGASATKGVASAAGSGLKLVGALLGVSVGVALVGVAISSGPVEPSLASRPNPGHVVYSSAPSSAAAMPSAASPASASAPLPAAAPPNAPQASKPPAPSTTPARSASLRDEIALLAGVQSALERGDGAEALRRLDGHATTDRQFIAERRAARIAALCLLGRVPEAQELAAVFLRENAQSVQRPAVERSCALAKTNPLR